MKQHKLKKRRNLRSKIYELKKYLDNTLVTNKNKCCSITIYSILEKMCDLFNIPDIEQYILDSKDYEQVYKEPEIILSKEEALDKVREIFNIKMEDIKWEKYAQ